MRHRTRAPFGVVAILAAGAAVAGQEVGTGQVSERRMLLGQRLSEVQTMAVESRITRGAPYSGEAVTDSLQVLADGTRIATKSVSRIYRDSQGRTRRERLDPASGNVVNVSISDPVTESTYVLDPRTKTAFRNGIVVAWSRGQVNGSVEPGTNGVVVATRMPDGSTKVEAGDGTATGGARVGGGEIRERTTSVAVGGGRGRGEGGGARGGGGVGGSLERVTTPEHAEWATAIAYPPVAGSQAVTEDLGQQMMEGVVATGKRTKMVIPVGAIGNDQPIEILTEQWMSAELSVLIMTKHSDPRSGITSYNLTNIVRAEQPHSLFEIPSDYELKDSVIRRQSPSMQ